MKKLGILVVVAVMLMALVAMPVMAAPAGKDTKANNNPQNLYLYPKVDNPGEPEWATLWEAEAWGKFNFKIDGQMISGVFNGHGLVADTDYTLISYNDPWNATPPFVVIGSGMADTNWNGQVKTDTQLSGDGPLFKILRTEVTQV